MLQGKDILQDDV